MCKNATATAASLMQAIEPSLKALLSFEGILNTPEGEGAINAYDAALAAIQAWTPGTVAQNVLQLVGDFQTVFNTLPLPPSVMTLTNIILAGIEAVIGVITANSPAPAAPSSATASAEESTVMYQAHVIAHTTTKVQALVPEFKRHLFTSAAHQYRNTWNGEVSKGGYPEAMKI